MVAEQESDTVLVVTVLDPLQMLHALFCPHCSLYLGSGSLSCPYS